MGRSNKKLLIEPFGIGHIVAITEAGQLVDLYCDLADILCGKIRDGLPSAADGARSMAAVYAAVASAKSYGAWTDARPPMFR